MLALQNDRLEEAEALSNEIAERMATTADKDLQRESARWEVVLKEMDLQASLKVCSAKSGAVLGVAQGSSQSACSRQVL